MLSEVLSFIVSLIFSFILFTSILFVWYSLYFTRFNRLFLLKRFQDRHQVNLYEGADLETIKGEANKRRRLIEEILSENLGNEFLESFINEPVKYDRYQFTENKFSREAQKARLSWQLGRDELLLFDRVVDTVILINRKRNIYDKPRFRPPTIKLERYSNAKSNGFPWRVIIETRDIDFFYNEFQSLKKWFAIRVDFAPVLPEFEYYGKCQSDRDGLSGVAGGLLRDSTGTYPDMAMTCSHVLSATCQSLIVQGQPGNELEPDAALISMTNPCFTQDLQKQSYSQLNCATSQDLQHFGRTTAKVNKIAPSKGNGSGFIAAECIAFPIGNSLCRFPAVQVYPFLYTKFGFLFPLWSREFSKRGDSGSWVVEKNSNKWIGMVIGGRDIYYSSYILLSEPLIQFFGNVLSDKSGINLNLVPYKF